ncbi:hypothetical protein EAI_08998 [Harpegnathos saltator]|uniref:Uncharacterized protein n=1 Tax=Harpegnathos saltator TaxID=610380 RepID=E2C304_HARSA|nr:hypothetical protein EAI_08998 [Harpegnathos saltator]
MRPAGIAGFIRPEEKASTREKVFGLPAKQLSAEIRMNDSEIPLEKDARTLLELTGSLDHSDCILTTLAGISESLSHQIAQSVDLPKIFRDNACNSTRVYACQGPLAKEVRRSVSPKLNGNELAPAFFPASVYRPERGLFELVNSKSTALESFQLDKSQS